MASPHNDRGGNDRHPHPSTKRNGISHTASRDRHRRTGGCGIHKRHLVSAAAILLASLMVATPDCDATATINGGASVRPPVRPRFGRRKNAVDETEGSGPTLGDLERMMQKDGSAADGGDAIVAVGPNLLFGSDGNNNSGATRNRQSHRPNDSDANDSDDEVGPSPPGPNQLRKNTLGRINLDLSGRVMCHIVSPPPHDHRDDGTTTTHAVGLDGESGSVPLFSLPKKQQQNPTAASSSVGRNLRRFVPHTYLGADYDLDEVWYGATRWIARCSWRLRGTSVNNNVGIGSTSAKIINSEGGNASSLEVSKSQAVNAAGRVRSVVGLIPALSGSPSSKSSLIIDAEGERSAFDRSDSTARLRLIRTTVSSSNTSDGHRQTTPQKLSVEYDSAKYYDTFRSTNKRRVRYAPAIAVNVQTPFLHPRLVVRSRRTWVVREGGDDEGNYYGGDHYGDESPADRRLESIKERYREGIPRSNPVDLRANAPGGARSLGGKVSRWLENDGWMPRRMTTDLTGNLVSVNEVGFENAAASGQHLGASALPVKKARCLKHGIVPHNAGIRLRVSKRIDWTSLGVFPWSKNGGSVSGHNNGNGGSNGLLDSLRSTRVRLELCGLYGAEGECTASAGIDVEPLDWGRTLKFIVGREDVGVIGDNR